MEFLANMNFTETSPNYYGEATASGAIIAGKFSQNTYPTLWQNNNNNATPQNSWWKSELIDISQYIVGLETDNILKFVSIPIECFKVNTWYQRVGFWTTFV